MKINGLPGEFAAKALVKANQCQWRITTAYYFSLVDVKANYPNNEVRWPVEEHNPAMVYIPAEEEIT